MSEVVLDDVCTIATGQSAPQAKDAFSEDGTPFIRAGSLEGLLAGKKETEFEKVSDEKAKEYRLKLFKKNTVIFAKSGMSAKLGRVYRLKQDCFLVSHLAAISPGEQVDPGYLHRWFERTPPSRLIANDAYPSINTSVIREVKIPLPPLKEQKRIAAILDKADALRRKRQQAIDLTDKLLRSVFLDMFGDPVTNPKDWEIQVVGELTDCVVPGRDKPKSFTGNTPWVTTNDLQHLSITTQPETFIGLSDDEIREVKAKVIPEGSVLMTCVGDLGVISIAGKPMVINQQLHAFQCGEELENKFLMYALSFQKNYMFKMASSTTVPYMNKTICNSIPVIVPPIELQKNFSCIADKIRVSENIIVQSGDSLDNLFSSLTQQAFQGELTKQTEAA